MSRVAIDTSGVVPDGKGISRVQLSLALAVAALELDHELVAFVVDDAAEQPLAEAGYRCIRVRRRPTIVRELISMPRAAREAEVDLVITTAERLPPKTKVPYVVWLYEVPNHRIEQNRLEHAGVYQRGSDFVTMALWKPSLRRAARLVAASEATAADVHRLVPGLSGLRVVYPGLGPQFTPAEGRRGDYVFNLGSSDPRDNTEAVLAAFASAGVPDVRLVIAGALAGRRPSVERQIASLGLRDRVALTGRVSDDELVQLYRGARAYLDASLYEGFGYQVLEAMACGAPVVATNVTSVPEVVGDAGLLCAPTDTDALGLALRRVLEQPELAEQLRSRGIERAASFTWQRTARAFADIFEEVLDER